MLVAASKTQLIVKLQKIWKAKGFPASQQAGGDLLVFLRSLGFDVNLVTEQVHYIKRVKTAVALDVSWAD